MAEADPIVSVSPAAAARRWQSWIKPTVVGAIALLVGIGIGAAGGGGAVEGSDEYQSAYLCVCLCVHHRGDGNGPALRRCR